MTALWSARLEPARIDVPSLSMPALAAYVDDNGRFAWKSLGTSRIAHINSPQFDCQHWATTIALVITVPANVP